ncbi:MAG: polyprenyl synthetase family protein [Candidatus Dormibacteraeota bacterium]|uniref:Polyprenyl synthetase family protein n=1 Tax=Candidatus Dormiibacter inghamiae TaxID=3127013 RepID=A0A934KB93_9BACT|nr:polyprenyl synthetase family protein [Candidatus Dormibacteraeota bacterium]MBJ7604739.1 polyprenyl synthetase family protein [Candidatus Dormibacteraeota bacterium]
MISTRRLAFASSREINFLNLTGRLQAEVTASGLTQGRIFIQSLHTTLGLTLNENEPLLLADLEAMLERLSPRHGAYEHDDFARRVGILADEPRNGQAHCQQLLLLPSCTVLVENGRLVLGRWQSVFAVELDGPRQREVAVQLEGEFDASRGRESDQDLVELELGRQLLVDMELVRQPMQRLVEAGGKRVRPRLVMLSARLGPDHDPLRAAQLAAAVELIHDATLVHDDYVDQAATRRGRASVASAEGPERAIAVGDYYFAKATRLIAELGNQTVTQTISQTMEEICLAQIDDVRLRGVYPGDYAMYLRVVRGKTAALFAAACRAGAQLANAPADVCQRLERFGEVLGIAFQMSDDLIDYSSTSGKPAGQDIRERAVSLPLIYATEHSRLGTRVKELLDGTLGEPEVAEIQRLVGQTGALERVSEEARGLVSAAVRELEQVDLNGVRPALISLAEATVDRQA